MFQTSMIKPACWAVTALLTLAFFLPGEACSAQAKKQPVRRVTVAADGASPKGQLTARRLTERSTEDDYPALAQTPDGTVWLVYVEYKPGQPIIMEQIENRRFDTLVPKGHGDQIRLMRFDGHEWHAEADVTEGGLDIWRPTVSVDGTGRLVVAWAQSVENDWDIFCRTFTPPKKPGTSGQWSQVMRVSDDRGSDFHVVSATDASGIVWLAWQGWRKDNFDIHLASITDGRPVASATPMANTEANEWSPAIAADLKGNVFVAWDTYEKGNYDVRLQVVGDVPRTVSVAGSAKFEARPHLTCDRAGRLWIAYEEGDEQWGKDYSIPVSWGRNRGEVDPGAGLYGRRTIQVKCLENGRLLKPTASLDGALADVLEGNRSLPRLAADSSDGLWLLLRHHPRPLEQSGGEVWNSYALRYDGRSWSRPELLPHSSNLLDNRPALQPQQQGVLAVCSSDTRTRTANRRQSDLFATVLSADGDAAAPQLVADGPVAKAAVPVVHPNESADVVRMREHRLTFGSKTLRLLRGDFHRHTEYTAHRDGDGLLEDCWRYALDAGRLDWLGNGDHDNGYGVEYFWWQIQKMTDLFHNPPSFVAVQSYERSNRFPDGHRNVVLPRRGVRPLPRGSLKGTLETGTPDTKLLYDYLKHFGGMCASHTSGTGMGTDWRDNDPDVELVVEIFQGCRQNYQSYEHLGAPRAAPRTEKPGRHDAGYVWNALAKGYRIGFQSSSDHFSTHISCAVVLAEDTSRQSIIDAFRSRHCYGANDNIVLIVRSGQHLMGDVFETTTSPVLDISVHAPRPIVKLHVVRSNQYVFTTEPMKQQFDVRFTDAKAERGTSYYYYVRVEQEGGSLAWASPMWITYAAR